MVRTPSRRDRDFEAAKPAGPTSALTSCQPFMIGSLSRRVEFAQPNGVTEKVSGGGRDGLLWLRGHARGEAYVMNVPSAGSELEWAATVTLPNVEGQGIAWDRSSNK